jgi:hypothetical protein
MKTKQKQSKKLDPAASAAKRSRFDIEARAIDMLTEITLYCGYFVTDLLEHGAGTFTENTACFDSNDVITEAGLEAILDAGLIKLQACWLAAKDDLSKLTRADIGLLHEFYRTSRRAEGRGEREQ